MLVVHSLSSGCTTGYTSGWTSGYTSGWTSGYTSGFSSGYTSGWTSGYTSGFSSGYTSGFSSGFTSGCTSGSGCASCEKMYNRTDWHTDKWQRGPWFLSPFGTPSQLSVDCKSVHFSHLCSWIANYTQFCYGLILMETATHSFGTNFRILIGIYQHWMALGINPGFTGICSRVLLTQSVKSL